MNRRTFADIATIRAAIFDVLDEGDSDLGPWVFSQDESETESEERHRFANAVVSRIEDLESNLNFAKLENLCPTHMRESLPRPTSMVCAECEKKQKAAERSMGNLNIDLFKKVRDRIAAIPESFDQQIWVGKSDLSPCGTVACLAGEAIICAAATVKEGVANLKRLVDENPFFAVPVRATELLGLQGDYTATETKDMGETNIFWADARGWPEPFRSLFLNAAPDSRSAIVVAYLDHIIETGKVLE